MGGVDVRPLVWALHRGYLRHGAVFVLCLLGILAAVLMSVAIGAAWWQLRQADQALIARLHEVRTVRGVPVTDGPADVLPLPAETQRFHITARILAGLEEAGFEPEQIRFKFENINDAGLIRQTAVFKLTAGWDDIARALAGLQASDRSIYLSKLRLERENPDDPRVTAEIQVAAAMIGAEAHEDGRP